MTARTRYITYAALLATVAVVAAVHEAILGAPIFPVDDAYITLHNAVALVRGVDPNYGVAPLAGATSPAHTLFVAALVWVMPPLWALEAAAWIAVAAYVVAVASLAFDARASLPVTLSVVALAVTVGETPHHLLNGLETGLALALTTFAVGKAYRDELAQSRSVVVPVLAGVLPFVRPELAALSVTLLGARWIGARGRVPLVRVVATDAGIALACALPFAVALWRSTGSVLPTTIAAGPSTPRWIPDGAESPSDRPTASAQN